MQQYPKAPTPVMDARLVSLIDAGIFFGSDGALALSKRRLATHDPYVETSSKLKPILQHINVLYSATASCASGSKYQKMRIPFLAYMMNHWADLVWKHANLTGRYVQQLGPGDYHVLMSVWMRTLQIWKKLRLDEYAPKTKATLYEKMIAAYNKIGHMADIERRLHPVSGEFDLGPAARLHLLGAGNLFELSREGLYTHPEDKDSYQIRNYIWRYCEHHKASNDRDMSQLVCRLFRAIGHHPQAAEIATRVGSVDQAHKAGLHVA